MKMTNTLNESKIKQYKISWKKGISLINGTVPTLQKSQKLNFHYTIKKNSTRCTVLSAALIRIIE